MRGLPLLLPAVGLLVACNLPTNFTGEAKFPGGKAGCEVACQRDNLEMGAFVYSGEFATSCVCRPRSSAPAAGPGASGPTAPGVEVAPTAGVEVQTQAAAAAAAANQAHFMRQQQMMQQRPH